MSPKRGRKLDILANFDPYFMDCLESLKTPIYIEKIDSASPNTFGLFSPRNWPFPQQKNGIDFLETDLPSKHSMYLTFLVFAVVGLGTLRIGVEARLIVLWLVLLGICLVYAEEKAIAIQYGLVNLGRGAVVGLVISLPLLLLAREALQITSARLFPWTTLAALFQNLVLLAAPIEGLYFRGFLQRERGLVITALLYGLAEGILFLPGLSGFPAVLVVVVVAMALLGFVYGYVCQRYGLSASISCHATVNLVLLFLPLALDQWLGAI